MKRRADTPRPLRRRLFVLPGDDEHRFRMACRPALAVLWLMALACCFCGATRLSVTRPHGFKTMRSARGPPPSGRTPSTTGRPVVYPSSGQLRPRLDAYGMPACAAHGLGESAYCVEDDSYPTQIIRNVLQNLNVDLSDKEILARQPLNHEDSIDQRVCTSKRKTIYPKAARSADHEWLYVVNDVQYAQAVTTEICADEEAPCDFVSSGLPPGYSSSCRQKFAYRKLLAMHPTEKKAYAENFPFPSCCVCYVKSPPLGARSLNPSRRRN